MGIEILLFLGPLVIYLLGAIPTGYLIVKMKKGVDITQEGSKVTGGTNVGRLLGKKWFFVTVICDMLKGFVPILILLVIFRDLNWFLGLIVLLATVGHVFPIFLAFKGGKGVATSGGAMLPILIVSCYLYPSMWASISFAITVILAIIALVLKKSISPLSNFLMIGAILFFTITAVTTQMSGLLAFLIDVTAFLVMGLHLENWVRLYRGTERKMEMAWEK